VAIRFASSAIAGPVRSISIGMKPPCPIGSRQQSSCSPRPKGGSLEEVVQQFEHILIHQNKLVLEDDAAG
jgi:hypothetical protein